MAYNIINSDNRFPTKGYIRNEYSWLCEVCETCNCDKERMEEMLESNEISEDRINNTSAVMINGEVSEIKENTMSYYVHTLPQMDRFKEEVDSSNSEEMSSHVRSLNFYMEKYITCISF